MPTHPAFEAAAEPSTPGRDDAAAPARAGLRAVSAAQRARRRRIVETAVRLLGGRDYEQVQMRDVADEAEVALGTLYRYFPSKELLAAEALVAWTSRFESGVISRHRPGVGSEERLLDTLQRVVRAFERHPHFFRLIGVLQVSTDPGVAAVFRQHGDRFTDALLDTLDEIHPDDAPDIAMTASALVFSLLQSMMLGHRSLAEVQDQIERSVRLMFRPPALRPAIG